MTVNFAILGAGRIGQVHARAVTATPGARLVAISDPMAEAAGKVAEAYGCDIRSIDEIAASDDVQAVAICRGNPKCCAGASTKDRCDWFWISAFPDSSHFSPS